MKISKYYIVANTREEFANESSLTKHIYNDHPSRKSIDYVLSELIKAGYTAEFFGGTEHLIKACHLKEKFEDTLFINLSDGMNHPSRKAQAAVLMEILGVPYTGSDPMSRLISGNKAYAKRIVSEKLDTPSGVSLYPYSSIHHVLKYPVVIKPNREGSSIGITQENLCADDFDLQKRLPKIMSSFPEILLEEYIPGYEITCFIIGNKGDYRLVEPLMCEYNGEHYFSNFLFGLEEKAGRKRVEILARKVLDKSQIELICNSAVTAFELLNMRDFARVDFRLREDGKLFFIELNGNPVISETSELGVISRETSRPFGELVGEIILSAEKRLNLNHA